tara:strand:- start:4 stop:477 length:474 start_codon:yes stop_codon:yes gene_type:complete
MKKQPRSCNEGAATEMGYIFTFLLGVVLLTSFSIWVYGIEQATRDRWTEEALSNDVDRLAEAIEKAEFIASYNPDAKFAEPIELLLHDATGLGITVVLNEDTVRVIVSGKESLSTERILSSASSAVHNGEVKFESSERIWVVLENREITVQDQQPGF